MKKYEIYWVDLDPTIGAEMQKKRPCLIVSPDEINDYLRTVVVVPLTSTARELPTRILIRATPQNGLRNNSYAVLDQIKTIDKSRLSGKIGEISESEKNDLTEALKEMFDY